MNTTWKTVRVFISSTFRDMQAERDWLVKRVFPALRQRLEPHRIHLVDIDLRWGITRQQADNDQVLGLCLQQIDECRPFFIGLLGGRYGWVPSKFPVDVGKSYGWTQHHTGKSVTELEVLHGVLNDPAMHGRALFCFRSDRFLDAIGDEQQRRVFVEGATDEELRELGREEAHRRAAYRGRQLAELKETIRKLSPPMPLLNDYPCQWNPTLLDPVFKSPGRLDRLEESGDWVIEKLEQAILNALELQDHIVGVRIEERDDLAEERGFHEQFIENRTRVYVGRQQLQDDLKTFVTGAETKPCLVTGPSGSGKSAALAKFTSTRRTQHPQEIVIAHFVGASPRSTSLREMLRHLCAELKVALKLEDEIKQDVYTLSVQFSRFLEQVSSDRRIVIVLDALNQLDETDSAHSLFWLPTQISPQVRLMVSCIDDPDRPDQPALTAMRRRVPHEIKVGLLTDDERLGIVREIPSVAAKTLDSDQIRLLLQNPATKNPLFLLVALEELRGFGSFEELNRKIAGLPQTGDTLTAIFQQVIRRLGEDFNAVTVKDVLTLLACSRHGLSERELLDLLSPNGQSEIGNLPSDDLFPILRQLRPYLQSRGPLLDFHHQHLSRAAIEELLKSESDIREVHSRLCRYFRERANSDGKGNWATATRRMVTEFPYHLWKSGEGEELGRLARGPFLDVQDHHAPDDPNLSLATIQHAIDAACAAEDAAETIELSLDHALRIERRRNETPLDVLMDSRWPMDIALHRAYALADTLDPEIQTLSHIVLAWKLQVLGSNEHACAALARLAERRAAPLDHLSRLGIPLIMRMSWAYEADLAAAGTSWLVPTKHASFAEALAAKGFWSGALQVAASIKEEDERAACQGRLVYVLIEDGLQQQAIQVAREIGQASKRLFALLRVAAACAQQGDSASACDFLNEAFQLMSNLSAPKDRLEALIRIAETQVKAGQNPDETFGKALAEAASVTDPGDKALALADIATAQVGAGRPAETAIQLALAASAGLGGVGAAFEGADQALEQIALAYAPAGAASVITFAVRIQDPLARIKCLTTAAELTSPDQAPKLLETAFSFLQLEKDSGRHASHLLEIIRAHAKAGNIAIALDLAGQIDHADSISVSQANQDLAEAYAKAGNFDAATHIALAIDDSNGWAVDVLGNIAEAMSAQGKDPALTFRIALDIALGIPHQGYRDLALNKLCCQQFKTKQYDEARETLNQIQTVVFQQEALVSAAEHILKTDDDPFQALSATLRGASLASTWRQFADRHGFRPLATDLTAAGRSDIALKVARLIRQPQWRDQALADITCGSDLSTDSALDVIKEIRNPEMRSEALRELSVLQVKERGLDAGLDLVRHIKNKLIRIQAIAQIASCIAGDQARCSSLFDQALTESSCLEDPQTRAKALSAIGTAQREAGRDGNDAFRQGLTAALEVQNTLQRGYLCKKITESLGGKTDSPPSKEGSSVPPDRAGENTWKEQLGTTWRKEGLSKTLELLPSLQANRIEGVMCVAELACAEINHSSRWAALRQILPAAVQNTTSAWRLSAILVLTPGMDTETGLQQMASRAALDSKHAATRHPTSLSERLELQQKSRVLVDLGEDAQARDLIRDALPSFEVRHGPDHPDLACLRLELARMLKSAGELEAAAHAFQQALRVLDISLGEHHPATRDCVAKLAQLLRDTRHYTDAERLYTRIVNNRAQTFGEDHILTWGSRHNLSIILIYLGRFEEAIDLLEQITSAYRNRLPPDHRDLLTALHDKGVTLRLKGEHSLAEPLLREALDGYLIAKGERSSDCQMALGNLAGLLKDTGRHAEANLIEELLSNPDGANKAKASGVQTDCQTQLTLVLSRSLQKGTRAFVQGQLLDGFEAFETGENILVQSCIEPASRERWRKALQEKRNAMELALSARIVPVLEAILLQVVGQKDVTLNLELPGGGQFSLSCLLDDKALTEFIGWITQDDVNLASRAALTLSGLLAHQGIKQDIPYETLATLLLAADILGGVIAPKPDSLKHSLYALQQVAQAHGLLHQMFRVHPADFGRLPHPLIAHTKNEQFLLFTRCYDPDPKLGACDDARTGLAMPDVSDLSGFVLACPPEKAARPTSLTEVDDLTGRFVWG